MRLLPRILGRIAFVRMEFTPADGCRTDVYIWRRSGMAQGDWAAAKGCLAAVVVCGHGVVTKPDDAEITVRVRADAGTFLWSSANGRTSFVRRERLQNLTDEFAAHRIVPVRVFCTDAAGDFGTVAEEFARQLYDGLRWRSLVRLTHESSAAAQTLVRRAAFPVLGVWLALLAANAVFSPRFNARRQMMRTELAAQERAASGSASADARQRKLLAEFSEVPGVSRALFCDHIARAVPDRVVLTALDVEPLVKRFEAGKPLQRLENRVVVCGTAPAAADVSAFVQRLSQTGYGRDVRLVNLEKERDGDRLTFRIETAL